MCFFIYLICVHFLFVCLVPVVSDGEFTHSNLKLNIKIIGSYRWCVAFCVFGPVAAHTTSCGCSRTFVVLYEFIYCSRLLSLE